MAVRKLGIAGLILATLLALSMGMASKQAAAEESSAMPAMQQQMQAQMQDMMVMKQNAAIWTSQGLVVLQGNRLLHYTVDLQLQQTITLPLPQTPALVTTTMLPNGMAPDVMAVEATPLVRSRVTARILSFANGLLVVRGQQVIKLDSNFKIVGQATLPDLPALSSAEQAFICPLSQQMMLGEGMSMERPGMSGMPMLGDMAPSKASPMP